MTRPSMIIISNKMLLPIFKIETFSSVRATHPIQALGIFWVIRGG